MEPHEVSHLPGGHSRNERNKHEDRVVQKPIWREDISLLMWKDKATQSSGIIVRRGPLEADR